ncbi:MAG: cytochrome c oxidase assembly protein [Thermomicrobiales bacterium]
MLRLLTFPPLHAGGIDPTGWLWSDWNVEPTIAVGLLVLAAGYLVLVGRRGNASPDSATAVADDEIAADGRSLAAAAAARLVRRQRISFLGGLVVLFVALGPPLDDWSDHYLLSAHMVQHLLLTLLAAPLLLYGTPAWMLAPLTRNRVTNAIGYWLTRPILAYAIANIVFVGWHLQVFYEAALRSQPVHVAEHMTMILTAMLAWWPILGPLPEWPRLPLPLQSLYFFAMTIPGSAVGAFITFTAPGLYSPYDTAPRIFGIDLATDQQVAGLLMWVVVSSIYLLLITVTFFSWASREEKAERQTSSGAPRERGAGATG